MLLLLFLVHQNTLKIQQYQKVLHLFMAEGGKRKVTDLLFLSLLTAKGVFTLWIYLGTRWQIDFKVVKQIN